MKFSYNKQRKVFVCSHLGEVIDTDTDWVALRSRHGMVSDEQQEEEKEQEEEEVNPTSNFMPYSHFMPYSDATASAIWAKENLGEGY